MVYVNTVSNPFKPSEFEQEIIESDITISDYLCRKYRCVWNQFDRPTICLLNGNAVSQKNFDSVVLQDGDLLCFKVLAGDPITLIFLSVAIVVSAASVYYASSMTQPIGVISNDMKSPDSVYNLNGQFNSSKLGQEIPCGYGKVRNYPDYAAKPYNLYKDNDQYQFSLFCLGHGTYDITDIKIGDTAISNFKDIEYEIILPNEKLDLFRDSVVTAIEVSNLELLGPNEAGYAESGPFVVNATSTRINRIQLDLSFPKGLFEQKPDGSIENITVTALISYREIDDSGNPVSIPSITTATRIITEKPKNDSDNLRNYSGKWIVESDVYTEIAHSNPNGYKTFAYSEGRRITTYYIKRSTTWESATLTKTLKTITPRRFTYTLDVPYGRYEIKIKRTSNKFTTLRFSNDLFLESLRGFMPNTSFYGDKTLLAVSALASNQLNNNSIKQINLVQTRKLKTWTGSAWSARISTRNPIWAAVDALTAQYGGRIENEYIDLVTFKTLADLFDEYEIKFDYIFSARSNVWDVIRTILSVGKTFPVLKSSKVSAIRDYEKEFPEYIYTDDNIIKGSFKRSFSMRKLSDYDGLQVEFVDGVKYKQENVLCLVGDDEGNNIETLKLLGVTNKTRAKKLGLYHRASKKYEREFVSFRTDSQGYLPNVNSLIGICHNTTKYKSFDLVKSVSGNVIILSKKHAFADDKTYQIIFKQRTGFASQVYYFLPSSTFTDTLTVTELDDDLSRLDGEEPLVCQFGETGKLNKLVRVKSINPVDINSVEIECVANDNRIYSYENIDDDPTDSLSSIDDDEIPVIGPISVNYITIDYSKVIVSWELNNSAKEYIIQYSFDNVTYSEVARVTNNSFVFTAIPGQIYIRVAGVNKGQGQWSTWNGIVLDATEEIETPDGLYLKNEVDDSFVIGWNPDPNCEEYIIKAYSTTIPGGGTLTFAGQKIFKLAVTKNLSNKTTFVEFTKSWLKDRCEKKEIGFSRNWAFGVRGKNQLSESFESFLHASKAGLDQYMPTNLTHSNFSGDDCDVEWDENGNPNDSIFYKVWVSTINGPFPAVWTLAKTTKKNTASITVGATRPVYWVVQVVDDWGIDLDYYGTSYVKSAVKTIS